MTAGIEARVLVCDPECNVLPALPSIFHRRFGGDLPQIWYIKTMHSYGEFESGNVYYKIVPTLEDVVEEVRKHKAPHYSLVIYDSEQVKNDARQKAEDSDEGSAGLIAKVRKHDFFLPQMIIGNMKSYLANQCGRAGALYSAENTNEALDQIGKLFKRPMRLPNLVLFKDGGSGFDFDFENRMSLNLEYVCQILVELHGERNVDGSTKRRIIVNTGAGMHGVLTKMQRQKYAHNERVVRAFPQAIARDMQSNLESIEPYFNGKSALLKTGAFYYINKSSTANKIPLIGTAPHYVMAREGIPIEDSDTHTVALAEFYVAERIVLIKRTDGIYDFDPYRGFTINKKTGEPLDLNRWIETQKNNRRHKEVSISSMLYGGISREGTDADDGNADGSLGHLMEDSALRYALEKCKNVKEICVVHIAPEEIHYKVAENTYRHVVTGEDIFVDPSLGWRGILRNSIIDAFSGKSLSKIVRN